MWLRIIITAFGLGVVLYFQFFFDFKAFTKQAVEETTPSPE